MSYCRWSSMNWRCDLYCYESSAGFETIVANNRIDESVNPIPEEPSYELLKADGEEWQRQHGLVMNYLDKAVRVPIGLPYDGERFTDPDLLSFRERLLELRAVGYRFPDYVFDDVDQEIKGHVELEKGGSGGDTETPHGPSS